MSTSPDRATHTTSAVDKIAKYFGTCHNVRYTVLRYGHQFSDNHIKSDDNISQHLITRDSCCQALKQDKPTRQSRMETDVGEVVIEC